VAGHKKPIAPRYGVRVKNEPHFSKSLENKKLPAFGFNLKYLSDEGMQLKK